MANSNNSPMKDMGRTHHLRMETNPLPMANKQVGHMANKLLMANKHLDPTANSPQRPMASKALMELRIKDQTLTDSKDPTEARAVAAAVVAMVVREEEEEQEQVEAVVVAAMEDGVMVTVVARAEGLVIDQREAGSEAEVVVVMTAAVAMTAVGDTTAAVAMTVADTTAEEEEDLLVWGKLQSATAPKVFDIFATSNLFNTPSFTIINGYSHHEKLLAHRKPLYQGSQISIPKKFIFYYNCFIWTLYMLTSKLYS